MDEIFQEGQIAQPRQEPARLTVVENIYHTTPGRSAPEAMTVRFGRVLKSREPAVIRLCTVGDTWKPLDPSWVPTGLVVIHNVGGQTVYVRLGDYETLQDPPHLFVPPGEKADFRPMPSTVKQVWLRCDPGQVGDVEVGLFPE